MNDFLNQLAEIRAICRIYYGEKEPTHLPKTKYFWDNWEQEWLESDKALIERREEALSTEQKAQGEKS